MYWKEYNITLEIGDKIIFHMYGKNYEKYVANFCKSSIYSPYKDLYLIESTFAAPSRFIINDSFKPSKELLRKHKLNKLLNVLGKI